MGALPTCRAIWRAGDLLVVNDTRVFAARLLGERVPSGGAVECLLYRAAPSGTPRTPRTLALSPTAKSGTR